MSTKQLEIIFDETTRISNEDLFYASIEQKVQYARILVENAGKALKNFEFRGQQKDICTSIVAQFFIDDEVSIILDAPTGTGKSIIAKVCTIALSLHNFSIDAFVLTSDKLLQKQYDNSLKSMVISHSYETLFGQNEYMCTKVEKPYNEGFCIENRVGTKAASALPCFSTCGYLQTRLKAAEAKLTVLNYHNWLIHQNYVNASGEEVIFGKRAITFFDEAHKIVEICQSMFSVDFTTINIQKRFENVEIVKTGYIDIFKESNISLEELNQIRLRILTKIRSMSSDKSGEELILSLKYILKDFDKIREFSFHLENYICANIQFSDVVNVEKLDIDLALSWKALESLNHIATRIFEYLSDIKTDFSNVVLDVNSIDDSGLHVHVSFRNKNAAEIMMKRVHAKSNFRVFMSASIGKPQDFARLNGIEKFRAIVADSDFDFSKSSIIKVCKFNMSMRYYENSAPHMLKMIDDLISHDFHKNQKGLIHSVSNKITRYIIENSKYKERFLTYSNTYEKIEAIRKHKASENTILIGASLVEGVDLPDEHCRFIIMTKIPYPNLGDTLIRRSMETIDGWYDYQTSIQIIQMLGRGIRHKSDWCVTYLLDSHFQKFFTYPYSYLPKYISNRVR